MCRVLILDDDRLLLRQLQKSLEGRQDGKRFKVEVAEQVDNALELADTAVARGEPFDVFLIDQRLGPGPNGIEAMGMLVGISPGSDAIILTALDDPDVGIQAYNAGAYQYLPKPFEIQELVLLLDSLKRWQVTQRERNWLLAFSEFAEQTLGEIAYSTYQGMAQAITEGALRMGFERAFMFSYDTQRPGELEGVYQAGKNILPDFAKRKVSLNDGVHICKALVSSEVLIVPGDDPDESLLVRAYGNVFAKPRGEWVVLPLWTGEQPIGVLVLDNIANLRHFRAEERKALRLFARLIVGSLERVRLYEQERADARRGDLLQRASVVLLEIANQDEEKMWLTLLTLATADYGLGFNRAWLFLSESGGANLRGMMGVGHLNEAEARQSWELDETEGMGFDLFLERLHRGTLRHTPLETEARGLELELDSGGDILSEVLVSRKRRLLLTTKEIEGLPLDFRDRFGPGPCAVMPFCAGEQTIGVVLVDNKFDRKPILVSSLNRLETFLNIAGLVWQNLRHRRQREVLLDASSAIMREVGQQPLRKTLNRICEAARTVYGADSAIIYPLKPGEHAYVYDVDNVAFAGRVDLAPVKPKSRPKSVSAHILQGGVLVVNDVAEPRKIAGYESLSEHPFIQRENVRAMIGVPITGAALIGSDGESGLGVLYLNYGVVQQFSAQDRRHAQTFANLAAIAILNARRAEQDRQDLDAAISRQEASQRELEILQNVFQSALGGLSEDELIRTLLVNLVDVLGGLVSSPALILLRWNADTSQDEPRACLIRYSLNMEGLLSRSILEPDEANSAMRVISAGWGKLVEATGELLEPVRLAEDHIGVFSVHVDQHERARDCQSVLRRFGHVAALTLDNVRRQEHLSSVLRAAQAVTEPIGLQQTFDWVVETVRRVSPDLSALTLWYRHPESDQVRCGTAFGVWKGDQITREEPPPGSLVWMVMESPEPLWVPRLQEDHVLYRNFVPQEKIVSVAAFPLKAGEQRVGAMFLNYRYEHRFSQDERMTFTILAEIVATSIRGGLLVEERRRESIRLETTLQTTEAIGATLEIDRILRAVLTQLNETFPDTAACVLTYDPDERQLVFSPVSAEFYHITNPDHRNLEAVHIDKQAIACRTARVSLKDERMVVAYIPDVSTDNDYLELVSSTRSELCVGLYGEDVLLGVLVLERKHVDGFSEEDIKLVKGIAQQITLAMARARQSDRLEFQEVVATATAWAADLAHDMNSELGLIRAKAEMIQEVDDLPQPAMSLAEEIEKTTARLAENNPFLREAVVQPILIDDFIRSRVNKFAPKYAEPIELHFDLKCPEVEVWGNPYFAERVVRHLVRNAARAMKGLPEQRLMVRTNLTEDDRVEIEFVDNGPGVPDELRDRILQERVTTKGAGGGFGLLLARQTVEEMDGTIRLLPSKPGTGATFLIRLPIRPEHILLEIDQMADMDDIDD
jgi:GAF domain-containing protein